MQPKTRILPSTSLFLTNRLHKSSNKDKTPHALPIDASLGLLSTRQDKAGEAREEASETFVTLSRTAVTTLDNSSHALLPSHLSRTASQREESSRISANQTLPALFYPAQYLHKHAGAPRCDATNNVSK